MHTNVVTCFICGNNISNKQLETAQKFTDINGKIKYRHAHKTRGCKINFKLKPLKQRKSPTLNKRQYVKKSNKIYDRNKSKDEFKKQLRKENNDE